MSSVAMDITETMDLVMVSETTVMNMTMTLLVVIIMVMGIMDHTEEVMIVGGNIVQSIKVNVSTKYCKPRRAKVTSRLICKLIRFSNQF